MLVLVLKYWEILEPVASKINSLLVAYYDKRQGSGVGHCIEFLGKTVCSFIVSVIIIKLS